MERYSNFAVISVPDGRFPRVWLQSPRRFASAGPSAHTFPAGVAVLHYNPSPTKDRISLKYIS